MKRIIIVLFLFVLNVSSVLAKNKNFDSEKKSAINLFDKYMKEVDRLDGDGTLPLEHSAVFISNTDLFQKSSSNDDDKFEIINFKKMIDARYFHLPWVRITYHNFNYPQI